MINDYIDLVVCKHEGCDKAFLFIAPAFSYLSEGTRVIVATKYGEKEAIVQASASVRKDSTEFATITAAAGAYEPLQRVLYKVRRDALEYKEDAENDKS